QHAPRIDKIPFAKLCDIGDVEDVAALDLPVRRVAGIASEDIACCDGMRIVVEAEDPVRARLIGGERMEPAAAADIEKIDARERFSPSESQDVIFGNLAALL